MALAAAYRASSDEREAPALAALAALGQSTRLRIFRHLVTMAPEPLAAGAIADALGCRQNTLSTHLAILARAGLVTGVRDGRSILYRADFEGMSSLVDYLLEDCCKGRPEVCSRLSGSAPLPDDFGKEDGEVVSPSGGRGE